ncbi:MAG TPA: hypothetical protein VK694_04495 [Verrucomicrobiae bacterium]|nr:hypothetical protein [Verrucomicrobiae bacterium]
MEREVGRVEFAKADLMLPQPHPNPLELWEPLSKVSNEVGITVVATHVAVDLVPDIHDGEPQQVGLITLRLWFDEREGRARTPTLPYFYSAAHQVAVALKTSMPRFDQQGNNSTQVVLGLASGYERDSRRLPSTIYHQHAPPNSSIRFGHLLYIGRGDPEALGDDADPNPAFRGFDKYHGAQVAVVSFHSTEDNVRTMHEAAEIGQQYFYTFEGIRPQGPQSLRQTVGYVGNVALREAAQGETRESLFEEAETGQIRDILGKFSLAGTGGVKIEQLWESDPGSEEATRTILDKLFKVGYVTYYTGETGEHRVRLTSHRLWGESQLGGKESIIHRLRLFRQ